MKIMHLMILLTACCASQRSYMKPTILVTGGAGYIGSHTAHALHQHGYNVIIYDKFVHNQDVDLSWATVIKGDLEDTAYLNGIFEKYPIDAVMHFAASIEVGESVANPALFYQNNVVNTLQLLNIMLKHKVNKLIFSSSCAIYGPPQSIPLVETHPHNPISPYGCTKSAVERILHDYSNAYSLKYVSLRYFNAAGAYPEYGLGERHEPETHIIPLLLRAAQEDRPFYVFGTDYDTPDGSAIRDYVHVRDLADAHIKALHHLEKGNPSDYFNLGTGNGISVLQMIEACKQIMEKDIKVEHKSRREGDPDRLIADPSKANYILEWKPQFSDINFILSSAYAFLHNQKSKS